MATKISRRDFVDMEHREFPIDPTPELSPTAQRILDAGVRVLDEHGFKELTYERIARESGENGALIRYHFGGKAGLIKALVDAVLFSQARGLLRTLTNLSAGNERRQALLQMRRTVVADPKIYRRMFEVIPYALRDPELRKNLCDLMAWYRDLDTWVYCSESPSEDELDGLRPLAVLIAGMLNGIGLQAQADPDLDVRPAFDLWERLVTRYLDDLRDGKGSI